MSFFKVNRSLSDKDTLYSKTVVKKLRYVVGKDGKGYWLKPDPPMPTDYEEDIYY